MSPKFVVAVLLIALGGVALTYRGYAYTTTSPTVTAAERATPISLLAPILGWVALFGGIGLLLAERKGSDQTTV